MCQIEPNRSNDRTSCTKLSLMVEPIFVRIFIPIDINIFLFFFYSFRSEQDEHQWSSLLKRQEEYYQMQLNSLHSVLTTTHNALRNVTETLHQLSKLSSGSS